MLLEIFIRNENRDNIDTLVKLLANTLIYPLDTISK